ncbi:MAG TPA: hypothetical protein VGF86_02030 [Candidatus Tumulicola sp.]
MKSRIPFILWFSYAFVAAVLILPALFNERINGDIFWQRWLGAQILSDHRIPMHLGPETLSAVGASWVPQEWLLSVILALAQRTGTYMVLAIGAVLAVLATMLLSELRSRRRGVQSPLLLAACAILIGLSARGTFGVRAQVFAWPLLALLLLLLDEGDAAIWWNIPLVAIWSNVHASVILAPIVALLYAVGAAAKARAWTPTVTRYAILVPALAAASCANPLGWRIPLYALSLERSPIHSFISEWQPLRFRDYGLWLLVIPVALGIGVAWWRGVRLGPIDALVTLAFGFLAFTALRNLPIFAIAVVPIACSNITKTIPSPKVRREQPLELALQLIVAIVVLPIIALATFLHSDYSSVEARLPTSAIDFVAQLPGPKRLFCFDFGACSLALGHSGVRSFMDGRCDPFPLDVWDQYRVLVEAGPGWKRILRSYNITQVLTPSSSPLALAIRASKRWKVLYDDKTTLVFARRSPYVRT